MSSNTAAPAEVRTCDGEEVEMMQTKTRGHFRVLAVVCFVALVVVTVPAVVIAVKDKEGDDEVINLLLGHLFPPANKYHLVVSCDTNVTRYSVRGVVYIEMYDNGVTINNDTAINCTVQDVFPLPRDYEWTEEWDCTGSYTTVVNVTVRDTRGEPQTNDMCFLRGSLMKPFT